MIEVSNIRLPLDAGLPDGEKLVRSAVANVLGVKVGAIADLKLLKRSVDARKKNDVGFVATYAVGLSDAQLEKRALEGAGVHDDDRRQRGGWLVRRSHEESRRHVDHRPVGGS